MSTVCFASLQGRIPSGNGGLSCSKDPICYAFRPTGLPKIVQPVFVLSVSCLNWMWGGGKQQLFLMEEFQLIKVEKMMEIKNKISK